MHHDHYHYGQYREKDKRQRDIHSTENNECSNNFNACNKEFLGAVMGKFGDIEKVARYS